MRRLLQRLIAAAVPTLLASLLVGTALGAGGTLDQSQLDHNKVQDCWADYACAQGFTPGRSGGLTRVRLLVDRISGSGEMLVRLIPISNGALTGSPLATATVPADQIPLSTTGAPIWAEVNFPTEPQVGAGQQYALEVSSMGDGKYRWHNWGTDIYAGGVQMLQDQTLTWRAYAADFAFEVYLNLPPAKPTISRIQPLQTEVNRSVTTEFMVSNPDGALTDLRITAATSDAALVPPEAITTSGMGTLRSLSISPTPDAAGTATITLAVSNGVERTETSFDLVVLAGNAAPVIGDLSDRTIPEDSPSFSFSFAISDEETPATDLTIDVAAEKEGLLQGSPVIVNNEGRVTVSWKPVPDAHGTTAITVTVSDGEASTEKQFFLTITPVNDPPEFEGPLPDYETDEDQPLGPITLRVRDIDDPVSSLKLTGSSSNTAVVPNANIVIGPGSAEHLRTLTITPAPDQNGMVTITLRLSDGSSTVEQRFALTIHPVNDPPTISPIANLTAAQGDVVPTVSFTISDLETMADKLSVSATSSNTDLVTQSGLQLSGTGTKRSLRITPVAGKAGTTTITVKVSDGAADATASFTLGISQRPTITGPFTLEMNEDDPTRSLTYEVSDLETSADQLVVTATSSNQVLLPDHRIQVEGSGSTRTVRITPAADQFGTATVTISVFDGTLTTTHPLWVTVHGINDLPAISAIPDMSTDEDSSTGPIPFTVSDQETLPGRLKVTATSSNQMLVSNARITLGGTGSNRTLTILPNQDQSGKTTITVTVTDEAGESAATSFILTVTAVNDPPKLTARTTYSMLEDTTGSITIGATDVDSPLSSISLTATSLDTGKIPESGLTLTGGEDQWALTLTPTQNASGPVTIRLTATDGEAVSTLDIKVTIVEVNDPPELSGFSDQATLEDVPIVNIPFTVDDVETPLDQLKLSGTSNNLTLAPPSSFTFTGSGRDRLLTITPALDQYGEAVVTITLDDGKDKVTQKFKLTVTSVPDPPRILGLADWEMDEDAVLTRSVEVYDPDSPLDLVEVKITSNNQELVPDSAIQLTGTGAKRKLVITPKQDAFGLVRISFLSRDDALEGEQVITLTVRPVNDPPLISEIADQSILEDTLLLGIPFAVGDIDSLEEALTVTATSSDQAILPNGSIQIAGSGAARTLSATPAPDRFGEVIISVLVSDEESTTTRSFRLLVEPVNDPPFFTVGHDQIVDEDAGPQEVRGWAKQVSPGPFEQGQGLRFELTVENPELFAEGPAVAADGTLTYTTALHAFGESQVSLRLWDDGGTEYEALDHSDWQSFTITVNPVNDLPEISPIPAQGTEVGVPTRPIPFTVSDVESLPGSLVVTAKSSNQSLVPDSQITLAGTGADRTIQIAPTPGRLGSAEITLTITDGEGSSTYSFPLIVNDLRLSGLTTTVGTMSPGFDPNILSYSVIYSGWVPQVSVTPTITDPGVAIRVQGQTLGSGLPSRPVTLGENGGEVEVVVYSPITGIEKRYVLNYLRSRSNVAELVDLAITPGKLQPLFRSEVTNYSASLSHEVTEVAVVARPADSWSKVSIEGNTGLQVGRNQIRVVVTAENGLQRIYTIALNREPAPLSIGPVDLETGPRWATFRFRTSDTAGITLYYQNGSGIEESRSFRTGVEHAITLDRLEPATSYTYRLVATRSNDSSAELVSAFHTEAQSEVGLCRESFGAGLQPGMIRLDCPTDPWELDRAAEALGPVLSLEKAATAAMTEVDMGSALARAHAEQQEEGGATVVVRLPGNKPAQLALLDEGAVRRAVAAGASLELQTDQGSVSLSPELLATLNPGVDGQLAVIIKEGGLGSAALDAWLSAGYRQVAPTMEVTVALIGKDGTLRQQSELALPLRLTRRLDGAALARPYPLSLFGESADGQVRSLGGTVDRQAHSITLEQADLGKSVVLAYEAQFQDVPQSHWAHDVIHEMAARQVLRGSTESQFRPDDPITRGQLAAILVRALDMERDERFARLYSDLEGYGGMAAEIGGAIRAGIISGYPDGTFRPDDQISRQEMAVVLRRLADRFRISRTVDRETAERLARMNDWNGVASWAQDGVRFVVARGLMTGRSSYTFAPEGQTTRAEAAIVIKRLTNLLSAHP